NLIESVRFQTLDMDIDVETWISREGREPPHHGLGRSMKVGKEEIVGLAVALQEFLARDHEAERAELRAWLLGIADQLGDNARIADSDHFYPRLQIELGEMRAARHAAAKLAELNPGIVFPHAPLARAQLLLCPEAIRDSERSFVERSLLEVLIRNPESSAGTAS